VEEWAILARGQTRDGSPGGAGGIQGRGGRDRGCGRGRASPSGKSTAQAGRTVSRLDAPVDEVRRARCGKIPVRIRHAKARTRSMVEGDVAGAHPGRHGVARQGGQQCGPRNERCEKAGAEQERCRGPLAQPRRNRDAVQRIAERPICPDCMDQRQPRGDRACPEHAPGDRKDDYVCPFAGGLRGLPASAASAPSRVNVSAASAGFCSG